VRCRRVGRHGLKKKGGGGGGGGTGDHARRCSSAGIARPIQRDRRKDCCGETGRNMLTGVYVLMTTDDPHSKIRQSLIFEGST